MSNVLIGIIGVILFIGLALAGALFLGPRFQDATVNSKASAAHQAMAQMTHAANLYALQEGKPLNAVNYPTNMQTLITAKYLKAPAVYNGAEIATVDKGGYGRDMPVDHVQVIIGPKTDPTSRAVCKEIEKQFGNPDPETGIADVTTGPGWETRVNQRHAGGCFLYSGVSPAVYAAYMSL
jgi:type II secretory pathway pseudopilin PulG